MSKVRLGLEYYRNQEKNPDEALKEIIRAVNEAVAINGKILKLRLDILYEERVEEVV